jgi:hypothetical protein
MHTVILVTVCRGKVTAERVECEDRLLLARFYTPIPRVQDAYTLRVNLPDVLNLVLPGRTIDLAVPQPWFDANLDQIRRRGGVCWYYPESGRGRLFGRPLYLDVVMRLYYSRLRRVIVEEVIR